jgi:hypothetical protein
VLTDNISTDLISFYHRNLTRTLANSIDSALCLIFCAVCDTAPGLKRRRVTILLALRRLHVVLRGGLRAIILIKPKEKNFKFDYGHLTGA